MDIHTEIIHYLDNCCRFNGEVMYAYDATIANALKCPVNRVREALGELYNEGVVDRASNFRGWSIADII